MKGVIAIYEEELSRKVIGIAINSSEVTTETFINAIQAFVDRNAKQGLIKKGRVKIKELVKSNSTINNILVSNQTLKNFEKTAKKYGISYSIKAAPYENPPSSIVFFQGKNVDVMTHCFKEFVHNERKLQQQPQKQSIRKKIEECKKRCEQINREAQKDIKEELVR